MFDLPQHLTKAKFDLVFDSQCFHVLRVHDEERAVAAIASLLVEETGLYLVLTGNADEPEVGPAVLSKEELVLAFTRTGLFRLLGCYTDRFDSTPFYETLPQRPLAHVATFQRTSAPCERHAAEATTLGD